MSPRTEPTNRRTSRRRVLGVDDEELLRWSLTERLRSDGYHVAGLSAGRQALKQAEQADLVLLDCRLPDADGLSLAEALRNARPSRSVILMTAYGTPELVERAAAIGVHSVLSKPFDLDEVARAVHEALCPPGGEAA
jgi:DNA-binding NtrC family response regulator